jgi:hypothetical protein
MRLIRRRRLDEGELPGRRVDRYLVAPGRTDLADQRLHQRAFALVGTADEMNRDGGVHEQAPSIRKAVDEIVSLGLVSLGNCQTENLRCPENTPTRRLLRGHDYSLIRSC